MIRYYGVNEARNGSIIVNKNNVIIKFKNREYIWSNFQTQKISSILFNNNNCAVYELNLENLSNIKLTRKLLDETFRSIHSPSFTLDYLIELVKRRINQNCQTLALIKENAAISTVGYEFRNNDRKYIKSPFLSDGATKFEYRKFGLATLLNLIAFSRGIEDNICFFLNNSYLFYVAPSFKPERRNFLLVYDESKLSELSPGFKTIISMNKIKGIKEIRFESFINSNHLPGHISIILSIYLRPKRGGIK
ncbi:MAG: hypothetical protein ACTSVV_09990 [Promethearchaeota archaeon]